MYAFACSLCGTDSGRHERKGKPSRFRVGARLIPTTLVLKGSNRRRAPIARLKPEGARELFIVQMRFERPKKLEA